jgi:hypothetical protein
VRPGHLQVIEKERYIFNPDAVDCGFTACVGFVCQK